MVLTWIAACQGNEVSGRSGEAVVIPGDWPKGKLDRALALEDPFLGGLQQVASGFKSKRILWGSLSSYWPFGQLCRCWGRETLHPQLIAKFGGSHRHGLTFSRTKVSERP
jgi:hypothetical protein